ncbi:hypothetical protein BFJ66_g88 [Fusarium oxysporum f. sp. cepae]|uniref:Uncharacterized protein n=1 Tax=Fusarium oxysporum f. sp. cepae TaxID=396571 RepID=A0A3L6NX18_FUSOX|nr:hypothetical protein BFJ65_g2391 [Fusarium oxysporum f. sp. cepae]RKK59108.1 hypothetical protein BFJ67_g2639 [Fusarium oxysporum f. sp. cepae]RKK64195.1 hypothetical protein BFJ66_g88 [Fusarium oxysporum f. sp. cepae]
MAETQSVEMKDSTEPAHKKPEERQTRYSQKETDRLEGELSPIDALATFIRPGVVIPPYPLWRHTANRNHLHGRNQRIGHIGERNGNKVFELIGDAPHYPSFQMRGLGPCILCSWCFPGL